ncbi:T9SS type A sorting domain-containing protein [Ekhidna sp.]|uniref:T9SS type A sorting domain-containing protein n=1 Tax=Ekhidna sp. TaxID=2608089 RepID=UPI003B5B1EA6
MKQKLLLSLVISCANFLALGQCPSYNITNIQSGTCVEPAGDIELFGAGNITLTVNGDLTINGNLTIREDLIVNGVLTVTGDIIARSGSLTIGNGGTVDVGDDFRPQNNFTSFFDIIIQDGGFLQVADDFDAANLSGLDIQNGGTVDVGGDFTTGAGSVTNIDGSMNVDGNFTNESFIVDALLEGDGNLTVGGTYTNNGDDSGFTGDLNGAPLPVELVYFKGLVEGNSVKLEWLTSAEINNEGFEIQKSADGENFKVIGFVGGHGNSNQEHLYTFTDNNPYSGSSFYRFRQVDFDGQFEYSPIVLLNTDGQIGGDLEVFPNPTNGPIRIQGVVTDIQLFDPMGRSVLRLSNTTNAEAEQLISQQLEGSAVGTYTLHAMAGNETYRVRIVKK